MRKHGEEKRQFQVDCTAQRAERINKDIGSRAMPEGDPGVVLARQLWA